jgi:hypothetical protein
MAHNPASLKRQKEAARREYREAKEAKKEQRRREAEERRKNTNPGEDPDLAGITPGPQPPAEE